MNKRYAQMKERFFDWSRRRPISAGVVTGLLTAVLARLTGGPRPIFALVFLFVMTATLGYLVCEADPIRSRRAGGDDGASSSRSKP